MRHMYVDIFEASTGSIVILDTFDRRHGYLTANNDTFYATAWADMGTDGPVVVEIPDGINARGAAHDMWWMEIAAMTKPGKYLFIPPGTKVPEGSDGFTVLKAPHNNFFIALRLFDKTDEGEVGDDQEDQDLSLQQEAECTGDPHRLRGQAALLRTTSGDGLLEGVGRSYRPRACR